MEEKHFQKNPNFVTRKIAGETLLVPIKASTKELHSLFTLNEVGSEIWELIDGQRNLEAIQDRVASLFEVDREKARNDLGQFFEALKEIGAIQEVSR